MILRLEGDEQYGPMTLRTGSDVGGEEDAALSMDSVSIALDERRLRWLLTAAIPAAINELTKVEDRDGA